MQLAEKPSVASLPPESGFDKASGSTMMLYQVTAFALIAPYSSPNLAPAHLIQCKGVLFIGNKIAGGEEEALSFEATLPPLLVSQLDPSSLENNGFIST